MRQSRALKHIAVLFAMTFAIGGLPSCGGDDVPDQYEVHVSETFLPVSIVIDKSQDSDLLQECRNLNMKYFVVTDADQLPEDPIGFSSAYTNVNFSSCSLLIAYRTHTWSIDTYSNRFVRNNVDKTYDWYLTLGSSDFDNDDSDRVMFTRFAIEVPKLPKNPDVRLWWSLSNAGWGGGWE